MNSSRNPPIGAVCSFQNGGTPSKSVKRYFQGDIPWITGADITSPVVTNARSLITKEAIESSATNQVPAGTVLLVTRTSVGKVAVAGVNLCFSQDITALTPDPSRLHAPYLVEFLRTQEAHFERQARGATIKGITRQVVGNLKIPLPSLTEQRRIAGILDSARALLTKRRAALAQLDILTHSFFLELFGDPATNPKNFPRKPLGELASKFSDGPFGSNLKSSHYTGTGVRVVRLQNIGVGEFVDNDKAYILNKHFVKLQKHECRPGDVLIGTLGDPNLRACIQPDWLSLALNKADCVQLRPNERIANAPYLCALLNQPGTERLAQHLVVGQTRLRISMGRLRNLQVPVPPLSVQRKFAYQVDAVQRLKIAHQASIAKLNALFASLQYRAFCDEL